MDRNFWLNKPMERFNDEEWDAICLKCGKCCVFKDFKGGTAYFSNRICDGLDMTTARCTRYEKRLCDDCVKVDMILVKYQPELLPETCAYRLLYEGKGLPDYHPLITGNDNSVRDAAQTVLDWPNVHSAKDLRRDLLEIARKCDEENWSDQKFDEEEKKIFNRYKIEFVAFYPIPIKRLESLAVGAVFYDEKPVTDI